MLIFSGSGFFSSAGTINGGFNSTVLTTAVCSGVSTFSETVSLDFSATSTSFVSSIVAFDAISVFGFSFAIAFCSVLFSVATGLSVTGVVSSAFCCSLLFIVSDFSSLIVISSFVAKGTSIESLFSTVGTIALSPETV